MSHKITYEEAMARTIETDSGCREWQGRRLPKGYAQVGASLGHRRVWEHHFGPIPPGRCVRHRCDNPPCLNIEHLELGTARDNSGDMVRRGRAYWSLRTRCAHGHDFAVHGRVRVRANGERYRSCAACKTDEQRRRRARFQVA